MQKQVSIEQINTLTTVWRDDLDRIGQSLRHDGLTFSLLMRFTSAFGAYLYWNIGLGLVERGMDMRARMVKVGLWVHGLTHGGLRQAEASATGLTVG